MGAARSGEGAGGGPVDRLRDVRGAVLPRPLLGVTWVLHRAVLAGSSGRLGLRTASEGRLGVSAEALSAVLVADPPPSRSPGWAHA